MSSFVLPAFTLVAASLAIVAWYLKNFAALGGSEFAVPSLRAGRYRPMLRLLAESDFAVVAGNKKLLRRLRTERAAIFSGYIRCLTLDYGRLLAGLRLAAVNASEDRPDLAWAAMRNRLVFANLLCRLDLLLAMHRLGVSGVDVSGLVGAMEALREQTLQSLAAPAMSA